MQEPDPTPRAARWRRALRRAAPYVVACALAATGLFFGSVGHRMATNKETFTDAVVRQIVNIPSPSDVFHKDRIYLMVLGIDYDYDEKDQPFSSHGRSDTIMVAGLDFPTKSAHLISVLRDTDAVIKGQETKINAAYALGGIRLADSVIGDFLAMPSAPSGKHFDRYVVVRVNALKDLVNAIGGIDVPVGQRMDYDDNWGHLHIHLKPGLRHLNGEEAQGYVRFRHDACSDPCRTKRQQQVLRIVIDKLKRERFNDLAHVAALIDVFRRDVDTNLTTDELKALAWSFKDANVADLSHAETIGYVDTKETPDGETVIANERQKAALVSQLLGPYASPAEPAHLAHIKRSSVHVVVENGSGIRGAAGQVADALKRRGYIVDAIGDADSYSYDTTEIRTASNLVDAAARVRSDLGVDAAPVTSTADAGAPAGAAVRIIVGRDITARPLAAQSPSPSIGR
jgi:LCP family protein required for cell wall assembly